MGHSPGFAPHTHTLTGSELGHFDARAFISACLYKTKFMNECYDYDIPYSGGIDVSGQTYFQDRDIPRWFYDAGDTYQGCLSEIDPFGNTAWYLPNFWKLHERVEFEDEVKSGELRRTWLCQEWIRTRDNSIIIGADEHFDYQPCHQIAEETEEKLVQCYGLDLVKYVAMCDGYVQRTYDKVVLTTPGILLLQPYEDENDMETLYKIAATGGPVSYMLLPIGQQGGHDGRPFWGA